MKWFHLAITAVISAVLLMTTAGTLSTAQQPGPCKMGYFDFQKILDDSVVGKKAQGDLQKKFGETKTLLEKKGNELKQLQEEIEKQSQALSPIVLEEKKNLFQAKYKSYLQQKMLLQEQYNNEFVKLVSPMQKEINTIVQALGKEKNYTMIFKYDVSARTDESVLAEYLFFPSAIGYFDPGQDITAEVLRRYDAAHKK